MLAFDKRATFAVGSRCIGEGFRPYVIAEVSANHNGSLDSALRLIKLASDCGADAVKLQTYTPETMTIASSAREFMIEGGNWNGKSLYDLYQEAHTPWEWHHELFKCAREVGITIFSTPFDKTAVDFLETLDVPCYKIASFEVVDLPLIKYVAATGKPIILSTGLANYEEICEAVEAAYSGGCRELAILHCVSGYPASPDDYNLRTLFDLKSKFQVPVGISDHTLGISTAIAGVALGASIVEKHFTLDRNGGGPDDCFSIEPDELKGLCAGVSDAWRSIGRVHYGVEASERENLQFRRSLYFVKALKQGDIVGVDDVRSIRPGFGLLPKFVDKVVGAKVSCDIAAGTAVCWSHISR